MECDLYSSCLGLVCLPCVLMISGFVLKCFMFSELTCVLIVFVDDGFSA